MRRKESGIGKHKTTFIFQQIIHMTCMTITKDGNQPFYDEPFTDREMRITLFLEITISGAPDKPCGVGRADANPKLLLNDT